MHETVPDTVLDRADEIILVDATPDELVARLKAGKVYLPQQAERAAQNFFRKGNLIALREIALRRTAERSQQGILAALESSHAIAQAMKLARELPKDQLILANLSGRGDKDVHTIAKREGITL